MAYLDRVVVDAGGIVLRYGGFYGAANDTMPEPVRKRRFPIVGDGDGVTSFVHLDDAAAATVLALGHDGAALYNVVDDEPAAVRDWLRCSPTPWERRPPAACPSGSRGSSPGTRRS